MVGDLGIKIGKHVEQIKPKLNQYCEEDLESIISYLLKVMEEIVAIEISESECLKTQSE